MTATCEADEGDAKVEAMDNVFREDDDDEEEAAKVLVVDAADDGPAFGVACFSSSDDAGTEPR